MLELLLFGNTQIDPDGHVHIANVLIEGLYKAPILHSTLGLVQIDGLYLDTSSHNDTLGYIDLSGLYNDRRTWVNMINNVMLSYLITDN